LLPVHIRSENISQIFDHRISKTSNKTTLMTIEDDDYDDRESNKKNEIKKK